MKTRLLACCAIVSLAWFSLTGLHVSAAPSADSPAPSASLAAEEKEACMRNLRQIYAAIQAYRADHKDLPNWLSDLVPQYLQDANVLVCPACRRTGKIESAPLADPNISTSYLFEFCPQPLGRSLANAPNRTRREWKRRQMGLVGSVVPIVRCRHHDPLLNLAFDGTIYESPPMWEQAFSNRIDIAELTAPRLFASDAAPTQRGKSPRLSRQFPPRAPETPNGLLDLSAFYNAGLTDSWHGGSNNNLAALPTGRQNFGGVDFDVRGIVQLRSKADSSTNFPAEIKGIRVQQKCERVHFLHAAAFGHAEDEGEEIGAYVLHFAANQMRLEVPIVYGQSVRDWHLFLDDKHPGKDLKTAWTGENAISKQRGHSIRLFMTTWTNVAPDVQIESIDFVSKMARPAPFLIAITVE
jgi:hypothetical protein